MTPTQEVIDIDAAKRLMDLDAMPFEQQKEFVRAWPELGWDGIILARHVLAERADGWQPIETAPKTGRTILLGRFNKSGKWRTMRGQWFSQEQIDEEWTELHDAADIEGWYETSVEADEVPNCWATDPTHWRPLPAPPTEEKP